MAPAKKRQRLSNGVAAAVEDALAQVTNSTTAVTAGKVEEKEKEKDQPRRSLFVRSLPATTTTESLTDLFSDSYPVKHATAVIDPATKQCRGYGFVTLADAEDAQRAKTEFNGHVLDGRKLRVEIAEPRQRDGENGEKTGTLQQERAKKREQDGAEPQQQAPRLIVRNLPWTIKSSEQLAKLFQSYGKVKQAYIPKKGPGLMAGFGFVVLRGRKNAEKAIEGANGKEVDGRTLAVDWAVAKDVYEDAATAGTETEKEDEDGGAALDDGIEKDAEEGDELMDNGVENGESEDEEEDEGSALDVDEEMEDGLDEPVDRSEDRSLTVFVRNLPFTATDEDLEDHFAQFGSTRYARVVMDFATERPKGTGFVCFYNKDDADTCLREAPRHMQGSGFEYGAKDGKPIHKQHSILQNDAKDTSGRFTMDGRVLQVTRAVDKKEANRLTDEGVVSRNRRDKDKRRLYLLSEGTISTKSTLWEELSPSERTMREASAKQRKQLIESNPSLNLSLTRLSVRNLPRTVDSKELKALAREAVVGFAKDAKAGTRQRLSNEELARGGDDMVEAEKARKAAGKGIVKQAKVVFEATSGSKVKEDSGAGRSRGYGFIEYYTHRSALMGLRWLNGHAIGYKVKDNNAKTASKDELQDRKKRLIVEFAIENAQVVLRRREKELKDKERAKNPKAAAASADGEDGRRSATRNFKSQRFGSRKRKRPSDADTQTHKSSKTGGRGDAAGAPPQRKPVDEKLAKRNQIIGRKRAARRERSKGPRK